MLSKKQKIDLRGLINDDLLAFREEYKEGNATFDETMIAIECCCSDNVFKRHVSQGNINQPLLSSVNAIRNYLAQNLASSFNNEANDPVPNNLATNGEIREYFLGLIEAQKDIIDSERLKWEVEKERDDLQKQLESKEEEIAQLKQELELSRKLTYETNQLYRAEKRENETLSTILAMQQSRESLTRIPNNLLKEINGFLNPSDSQNLRDTSKSIRQEMGGLSIKISTNEEARRIIEFLDHNKDSINTGQQISKINLFNSGTPAQNIVTILSKTPNLEELNLGYCHSLNGDDMMEALNGITNPEKLKKIDLSLSKITAENLKEFLSRTSNLEEIDLKYCKNLEENGLEEALSGIENPEKLKTLNISSLNITPQALRDFLLTTPNLEEMYLGSYKGNLAEALEGIDLTNLKKISLSSTNITKQTLSTLFSVAPNLEEFDLGGCQGLDVEDLEEVLDIANLDKLKKLHLYGSDITPQNLGLFLSKTPNLEEISLSNCQNLDEEGLGLALNSIENPEKLKKLNLHGLNIKAQSLGQFLSRASSLEDIDFGECRGLDVQGLATILNNIPNPEKLKKVNLHGSGVTQISLGTFLSKTSSLEYLDIGRCRGYGNALNNLPNPEKLTWLNISRSDITAQNLGSFLSKTSGLEDLSLKYCGCTREEGGLEKVLNKADFRNLKKITLFNANASREDLSTVLLAPNLATIDLRSINNLDDDVRSVVTKEVEWNGMTLPSFSDHFAFKKEITELRDLLEVKVMTEKDYASRGEAHKEKDFTDFMTSPPTSVAVAAGAVALAVASNRCVVQ